MPPIVRQVRSAEPVSRKGVRLAVNPFDLDRVEPFIRETLLAGKLGLEEGGIRMDKDRMDEAGVAFSCDLLSAACICDMLRDHDRRAGDSPTRVYLFRRGWSKLPGHAVLTDVADGECRLSQTWFPVEPEPARPVVFSARRI